MGNFTDKDKGWGKIMTSFEVNAGETAGFAGYLRSSSEYKPKQKAGNGKPTKAQPPITIAQLAAIHEYGTKDRSIPERSFMRTAMDANGKELRRLAQKIAFKVTSGGLTKEQGIGLLCQRIIDLFAQSIDSNIPPPNKPATVAAKGSSHTLIDTGQLKNSLDWEIRAGGKK